MIKHKDCIYFNLHAEQSFTGSFLADKGDSSTNICEGIYGSELKLETLENVTSALKNQETEQVVLDFRHINDVQSNLFKLIIEINKLSKVLILKNIKEGIIEKLNLGFFSTHNCCVDGNYELFVLATTLDHYDIQDTNDVFQHKFIDLLINNTINNEGENSFRHNSPVYIPKFIDVKGMLTYDTSFFTYVVYNLAINISNNPHWIQGAEKPTLFCQNLNGSYIASILSRFLKWDMISMDHIGPANKVYSTIGNKIQSEARYIVISDVICLGTEIKICQNIINYSGGRYVGNACIVKIETLRQEHRDSTSESVFSISSTNNPIDFRIITALEL